MNQSENTTEDYNNAYVAGKKQIKTLQFSEGIQKLIYPKELDILDLTREIDDRLSLPKSLVQNTQLSTCSDFIEYVKRYMITETTVIFYDNDSSVFTAIFDFHESQDKPNWKRHTAKYQLPKTKPWQTWIKNNNMKMSQEDFAFFIEANALEISTPTATEIQEIALTLKATKSLNFRESRRIDNGQVQFKYEEKIEGQAGTTGQLEIPEKITITVQPYHKAMGYNLSARLRWRITQDGTLWWYTLIRPQAALDDAVEDTLETIRNELPVPCYEGQP